MCCFTVIRAVEACVSGIAIQKMAVKSGVARFATAGSAASALPKLITLSHKSGDGRTGFRSLEYAIVTAIASKQFLHPAMQPFLIL